jgi:hypothetical protein
MKKLLYFIAIIFLIGCSSRNFAPPENVIAVLNNAQQNKAELEKVIHHYQQTGEVIKEEAAYFLIANMEAHGYLIYHPVDEDGKEIDWDVTNYSDYGTLQKALDSIQANRGEMQFERDTIQDHLTITAEYLIQNIDLAYQVWNENPWASHLDFFQFREYILPYRSSEEPLQDWRSYFIEKYSWVKDSVKDPSDPIEASILINNDIKSWFRFDPRYYHHPTDQGLDELVKEKTGRCEDMTNLAIYAMRANGIPVMSDFTPYWANSGNNHAWNAILDKNDSIIIFMGGESNPGEYQLNNKLAKVYRKTFGTQEVSLASQKKEWESLPPYLNRNNIADVTADYVPVSDIKVALNNGKPDSVKHAYVCVFNSGEWKAIDHGRLWSSKAHFYNIGRDIVYLPAFYIDEEIVPAGNAFILDTSGQKIELVADGQNLIQLKLTSTTKKVLAQTTDSAAQSHFNNGKTYTLFYWNDRWVEAGSQQARGKPLTFNNIPSNALYWLVEDGGHKEERIFTLDLKGHQHWW